MKDRPTGAAIRTIRYVLALLVIGVASASAARERLVLVEQGQPRAAIVIATDATRAARLGAFELQYHVKRISGAELPIVTQWDAAMGLPVCVGDSPAARELGHAVTDWAFLEYAVLFGPRSIFLAGHDAEDRGDVVYDTERGVATLRTLPGIYDPQGTLHAVYVFLEQYGDVRWWNATEFGLDAPRRATLAVEPRPLRRQPDFTYRDWTAARWGWPNVFSQSAWHDTAPEFEAFMETAYPTLMAQLRERGIRRGPEDEPRKRFLFENAFLRDRLSETESIWLRRLRLGGSLRFVANHSTGPFYTRFREPHPRHPETFVEKRPDWFAQGYEGRPNQLCYTHAGVLAQFVQDARDYFDGKLDTETIRAFKAMPDADYFPVVPSDSGGYCRCARCEAALNPAGADTPIYASGRYSDYWFAFVNRVAREVARTHPDKFISTLAYAGYRAPPSFPLEDNIAVQICLGLRQTYDTAVQEGQREALHAWAARLPPERTFIWAYYCFPRERAGDGQRWHFFPGFFARSIPAFFREYHHLGAQGIFFNGWGEDIDTYLTLQLLNDVSVDADATLAAYFRRYFGAAAEPMAELYDTIERAYGDPDLYPDDETGRGLIGHQTAEIAWGFLGTHERMEAMRVLLDRAYALADTETEKQRVEIFDKGIFSYMEEGRRKYERTIGPLLGPRFLRVPAMGPHPEDRFAAVDWAEAFAMTNWRRPHGEPTRHQSLLRLTHDGERLHLRYDEFDGPGALRDPDLERNARLEIALAVPGDPALYFLDVSPDGSVASRSLPAGDAPATRTLMPTVIPARGESLRWGFELSLPLASLGLRPGDRFRMNARRHGDPSGEEAVWHCSRGLIASPDQLGQITLDPIGMDQPGEPGIADWPAAERITARTLESSDAGHIEIPGDALDAGAGPLTMELWVRRALRVRDIGIRDLVVSDPLRLQIRGHGTRIVFLLTGADGQRARVDTQFFPRDADSIAPHVPTHLVGVWDGGEVRFYLNGRPHGVAQPFAGPLARGEAPLRVGDARFGVVEHVAFYRRASTPADVRARFRAGFAQRAGEAR